MKKICQELLIELYDNGLKNPLLSPIWILKYENVYHKGSFYLKVYLLENTDITKLNEVQFELKSENKNCLINIDTFNKAESYKYDSVLGCLVKLPIEFENKSFELQIRRLVIDNKISEFNETDYGIYRLNEDQTEIEKNKYLSNTLKNYSIFPSHIEDDMWICTCGKVNCGNECNNCKNTIDDLNRLINEKLGNLFIRLYAEKNPFKANPKDDIHKNLINYFRPLNKFGFNEMDAISFNIDVEKLNIDLIETKSRQKKNIKNLILSILLIFLTIVSILFAYNLKQNNLNEIKQIWNGYWAPAYSNGSIQIDVARREIDICIPDVCEYDVVLKYNRKDENITFEIKNISYKLIYKEDDISVLIYSNGIEMLLRRGSKEVK